MLTAGVVLRAVCTGRARAFGPAGQPSAIDKHPCTGRVILGPLGLQGDKQGDRRVHGGVDKAVHHYPFEHYAAWRAELGESAALSSAGAFGENLSTQGLTEHEVCVGDRFRAGSALLEVSQARQPCWKVDVRFGAPGMARRMQDNGRTGWYYRVIEAGELAAGDRLELIERPCPDWPLARLLRVLYHDCLNREDLFAVVALAPLAEGWRRLAAARLDTGRVEDWSRRLSVPPAGA